MCAVAAPVGDAAAAAATAVDDDDDDNATGSRRRSCSEEVLLSPFVRRSHRGTRGQTQPRYSGRKQFARGRETPPVLRPNFSSASWQHHHHCQLRPVCAAAKIFQKCAPPSLGRTLEPTPCTCRSSLSRHVLSALVASAANLLSSGGGGGGGASAPASDGGGAPLALSLTLSPPPPPPAAVASLARLLSAAVFAVPPPVPGLRLEVR